MQGGCGTSLSPSLILSLAHLDFGLQLLLLLDEGDVVEEGGVADTALAAAFARPIGGEVGFGVSAGPLGECTAWIGLRREGRPFRNEAECDSAPLYF